MSLALNDSIRKKKKIAQKTTSHNFELVNSVVIMTRTLFLQNSNTLYTINAITTYLWVMNRYAGCVLEGQTPRITIKRDVHYWCVHVIKVTEDQFRATWGEPQSLVRTEYLL